MDAGVPLPIPHAAGAGFDAGPATTAFLLLAVPLFGRIFLAWFPPGLPGRHTPRELPATWAASHLVGLAWLLALRELGLDAAWPYVALGVPALALIVRVVTSPAGLVPRHEPVTSATWPASLAALVVLVGVGAPVLAQYERGVNPLAAVNTMAALVLLVHGLHVARAPVGVRVGFVALVAPFLVLVNGLGEVWTSELLVLPAAAFAAGTVAWLRRGDQRALALCAVGLASFAALPNFGVVAATCVAAVVMLATARPVRLRAAVWCGLAVLIGTATRLPTPFIDTDASRGLPGGDLWLACGIVPCFLLATVALPFLICAGWSSDRRQQASWNPSGAPRGREARTLLLAAVVAWIPFALDHFRSEEWTLVSFPIVESWTLVAFAAGLGLTSWTVEGATEA